MVRSGVARSIDAKYILKVDIYVNYTGSEASTKEYMYN